MSDHEWHVALNKYNEVGSGDFRHWMYEAKTAASEVPRMELLFKRERLGQLPKTHQQCSMSAPEPVDDNHLSCCMGVECRKCPHLLALESPKMSPEAIDRAKAWTCASHILHKLGDNKYSLDTSEGYLLTTDDKIFWKKTYESMSNFSPAPPVPGDTKAAREGT